MSKIGNKPIVLPSGVTVEVRDQQVVVRGSNGEQQIALVKGIEVAIADNHVVVSLTKANNSLKAKHGLMRSLIANMINGVSAGFSKRLKLVGTGYRVAAKGTDLQLTVGFSHPVIVKTQPGIKLSVEGNDTIIVAGTDKQAVGQMAADIRKIRPPEPYKGKGIRYEDEHVMRKQGKTVGK